MGALNRDAYEEAVLLTLGNVPTSHPVIAGGLHLAAINHAPNRLIRENPDYFPEHHDRSWTDGPTIVTDNRIPLPENMLILEAVRQSDGEVPAGSPPQDWSSLTEHIVTLNVTVETIGLLAKTSDESGFPIMGARKGNDFYYWPTTRTGYETYFRYYGISRELSLASAGATFRMHEDYDQTIVYVAASETAIALNRYGQARELLQAAREMSGLRIGEKGMNVIGRESSRRQFAINIAGMP